MCASVVDSTLQPGRLELLDGAALTACGLPAAPAALAISFASVEGAVRAQQAEIAADAARRRARVETAGPAFWRTYDRMLADRGPTVLRVTTLASRVAATAAESAAALGGADGVMLTACAPLGLLRLAIAGRAPAVLARAVERLRAFVARDDGSVVIERAPADLRTSVDPWGPPAAGTLDLMRGLKQQFDPRRTLNPGRFVGGI
jgi:glycolate oxidase FAD binding subunit